jgi:hypothetical protein
MVAPTNLSILQGSILRADRHSPLRDRSPGAMGKMRKFWEAVSTPPLGVANLSSISITNDVVHRFVYQTRALGIMIFGAQHFFTPRQLSPVFWPSPNAEVPPPRMKAAGGGLSVFATHS